jgi:hypothetical protein
MTRTLACLTTGGECGTSAARVADTRQQEGLDAVANMVERGLEPDAALAGMIVARLL